jgi:hypothetical protein
VALWPEQKINTTGAEAEQMREGREEGKKRQLGWNLLCPLTEKKEGQTLV